ncbi:MAG TPA: hypothetical protein VFF19_28655 [Reyranella sp.]|nr:hypothetical protein [Reyranella sp.]
MRRTISSPRWGGGETANMPCWTSTIINALGIARLSARTSRPKVELQKMR